MNALESELQSALLLAAPIALRDVRLFRRNIGKASFKGSVVAFGIRGQSDVYAIVRGGRIIELELKTADGRLSKDQLAWQSFCRAWSVPHAVLRALAGETVEKTVARWLTEIGSLVSKQKFTLS